MDNTIDSDNLIAWKEFGFWMSMAEQAEDSVSFIKHPLKQISQDQRSCVVNLLEYSINNLSDEALKTLWLSGNNNQSMFGDVREVYKKLLSDIQTALSEIKAKS
jgi:hypothetical protein